MCYSGKCKYEHYPSGDCTLQDGECKYMYNDYEVDKCRNMNLKIKELNINNKKECIKYENFVLENGYLYQSLKWYNIIKNSYNLKPIYLYLENNNKILEVLPLFYVNIVNELVSIPHFDAGGFINNEHYAYFLDYIQKNCNVKKLKIYQFNKKLGNYNYNDQNSIFFINVPDSLDKLYRYFKQRTGKSMRRLLEETEVIIQKGISEEYLNYLYQMNVIRSKEFGIPHHSYSFLKELTTQFKNNSLIFIAKYNNKIIGASYIIFYNNIAYPTYQFIPQKYLYLKTTNLLLFSLFKESLDRNILTFSFGRSFKDSGPYRFKKKMHATEYPLYIYKFSFKKNQIISHTFKASNEKYRWVTKIWSKLPNFITNTLSSSLRKYVY